MKRGHKADCMVIFVRCNDKTYQVSLTTEMEASIFNILSQMFYPKKIQVNRKEIEGIMLKKR